MPILPYLASAMNHKHDPIRSLTAIVYIKIMLSSLMLLASASVAFAKDPIYKSVDEKGKVTYSNTPPQNNKEATNIEIAPPPSEQEKKAAQERHERNQDAASILDENRKKRNEINAEENRLKRENQKQLQQQREAENNNENRENYGYPYIPGRHPGGSRPPGSIRPPIHRPIQLPSR